MDHQPSHGEEDDAKDTEREPAAQGRRFWSTISWAQSVPAVLHQEGETECAKIHLQAHDKDLEGESTNQ